MTLQLPLIHRIRQPASSSQPPPMLVLLHGYGSNEHDLFSLANYLDPQLLVVSARAPHQLMPGAFAWFALDISPRGIAVDAAQAAASHTLVAEFVAAACAGYGADPARVLLGGFSQGGMMTAAVLLSRPELLAGALILSGMVPRELMSQLAPAEQLAGKPVLMQHGTHDQVLPVQLGRAGRDILAGLPLALTYHEYPMAHEISAQSLADLNTWLAARLGE